MVKLTSKLILLVSKVKRSTLMLNKEGTGKVEDAKTVATTNSVEKGTKFVAGNNLSIRHDGINGDANYDRLSNICIE